MKYYTYILESIKNSGNYLGSTENLKARLKKHNKGDVMSTRELRLSWPYSGLL